MSKYVIICPNPYRDIDYKYTLYIYDKLTAAGVRCSVHPLFEDVYSDEVKKLAKEVAVVENI